MLFSIPNFILSLKNVSGINKKKTGGAKGLRSPVNYQQLFDQAWSAWNKHGHQRCKAPSLCNIYYSSILQVVFVCPSYNVFPTTSISPRLSRTISQNVFLTTFFFKTTSSTSNSQRLSHDVFPITSPFLTTTFQQCFFYNVISQRLTTSFLKRLSHNAVLMTSISQRLSHNFFLTMSFLQRLFHKDFLKESLQQRLSYNVFLITNF